MKQIAFSLAAASVIIAVSCGPSPTTTPTEPVEVTRAPTVEQTSAPDVPARLQTRGQTLAAGELDLPSAGGFGDPGFHEVVVTTQTLPADLGPAAGMTLVLTLRDAGRPEQTCSTHHPLSGCATVDWSDDPSRPKVPPGGVFDNSLTLQLETGARTLFLSGSGALTGAPDPFEPG